MDLQSQSIQGMQRHSVEKKKARGRALKQYELINCTTSYKNVEKKKARVRALKNYLSEKNPIG